jgi:4-amino-4-deoxy-L-arabinose transferase-like glycosyltransferase
MNESGDFVTPRLNYVRYFEKPALLYWMTAASYKIFGENEFAARLPSALSALAGVAVTGLFGAYTFGRRCGLLAAVIAATSLLHVGVGTIALTDMPVAFFITASAAAFYTAARGGGKPWYTVFWAAMALATLTKGLIGIALPGGIAFWYIVVTRKWRLAKDAFCLPGVALFLALSLPWFYLVCRANPDFFRFFFVQEHFLRYTTRMHSRYEPFWFFLPLIPAGMMPWTGFLPQLFSKRGIPRSPGSPENGDANVFLLLWFGIILLFFSLSSSKLIPYITPCVPPLAILTAAGIDRMIDENRWFGGAFALGLGIPAAFAAALLSYALLADRFGHIGRADALALAALLSPGLLGGAAAAAVMRKKRAGVEKSVAALCAGALLFAASLQAVYIPMGKLRSTAEVAKTAAAHKLPEERIAVFDDLLQGVPFYARERVILIDALGELAYGAGEESAEVRREWFPKTEEFLARWDKGEPFALILEKEKIGRLFGNGDGESEKGDSRGAGSVRLEVGSYAILFNREK